MRGWVFGAAAVLTVNLAGMGCAQAQQGNDSR